MGLQRQRCAINGRPGTPFSRDPTPGSLGRGEFNLNTTFEKTYAAFLFLSCVKVIGALPIEETVDRQIAAFRAALRAFANVLMARLVVSAAQARHHRQSVGP
jgi:hypothetical protein